MDFYEKKVKAFTIIDGLVLKLMRREIKQISLTQLYIEIAAKFGFSENFVNHHLKLLQASYANVFEIKTNTVELREKDL
jgi:hypothetical protein